ncbi:hypothetical protein EU805_16685 [Salipiger sp. IMCC34102]|uniref:hypothetical protein n=1 Tax=Salipiger sp. IMCC34102 TaxID=2510647 RepID=UPI00101C44F7|nr:hypothetical protein [Salipiger sp. IMCC34102]RYH00843.1 hypothetical protein EU805_16685 [Salipiger sp. IMCC34102]
MNRLILPSLLAAGPALAECPKPSDLATGIRVEYSDGMVEVFRSAGPGMVEAVGLFSDGEPFFLMEMARGLYVTSYAEIWGDFIDVENATLHNFGAPATELPLPVPGKSWDAQAQVIYPGEAPGDVTQRFVSGASETLTVGDCSFESVEVITAYERDDNYVEGMSYLRDFGFGWLSWADDDTDGRLDVTAVSIAPIAPGNWPLNH